MKDCWSEENISKIMSKLTEIKGSHFDAIEMNFVDCIVVERNLEDAITQQVFKREDTRISPSILCVFLVDGSDSNQVLGICPSMYFAIRNIVPFMFIIFNFERERRSSLCVTCNSVFNMNLPINYFLLLVCVQLKLKQRDLPMSEILMLSMLRDICKKNWNTS